MIDRKHKPRAICPACLNTGRLAHGGGETVACVCQEMPATFRPDDSHVEVRGEQSSKPVVRFKGQLLSLEDALEDVRDARETDNYHAGLWDRER